MKNKKGFTLIELAVSIVLVSVVLVTLIGSLLQLRKTYNVVHENSDIVVYTSSASMIINGDIIDHKGIRFVSCELDGKKCNIILCDDEQRELIITTLSENSEYTNDMDSLINYTTSKTTLEYFDTTKYNKTNNQSDKKLIYIRTLSLDKYENEDTKVTTTTGYNFYDMSATQYEYTNSENNPTSIDIFTTIVIKIFDGIDMDLSKYSITIYGAGTYDYNKYKGKIYKIDLDNNEADTSGTTSIDEMFGVGFFKSGGPYTKDNMIQKITPPTKADKAFLGYYYKPNGVENEQLVITSSGEIDVDSSFFKNNVILYSDSGGILQAKWGDCKNGYELVDGNCNLVQYSLALLNSCTNSETVYTVYYDNRLPSITVPQCEGSEFRGYYSSDNVQYYSRVGKPLKKYNLTKNSTFTTKWHECDPGEYYVNDRNNSNYRKCVECGTGSYSVGKANTSCIVCEAGKTYNKDSSSCVVCSNSEGVLTWKSSQWNSSDNSVSNNCKIESCLNNYHKDPNNEACVINN